MVEYITSNDRLDHYLLDIPPFLAFLAVCWGWERHEGVFWVILCPGVVSEGTQAK